MEQIKLDTMLYAALPQVDNKSLINLVQVHDVLYDSNHPKYSDTRLKEEIWEQIAHCMRIPVSLCKRSWFSLRDSFRRSLRKRRDAFRDNLPYRKWRFEDEMRFLESYIAIRDPNERNEYYFPALQDEIEPGALGNLAKKAKKPRLATSTKKTENYAPRPVSGDHIDAFLLGIGATLKNFTPRNQNLAKSKIFSLVAEMELQQITECKGEWPPNVSTVQVKSEHDDDGQISEAAISDQEFESDGPGESSMSILNVQLEEGGRLMEQNQGRIAPNNVEGMFVQHIKEEKSCDDDTNYNY